MRVLRWICFTVIGLVIAAALVPLTAADADAFGEDPVRSALVVPIHGTIDQSMSDYVARELKTAAKSKAEIVLFDLDTYGGRLDSAITIGETLRESELPTVVFVRGNAASAGSYIALNAKHIVMSPGSSIGAAAVVDENGKLVDDPKTVSFWVSKMKAAAEFSKRNPDIAAGMADRDKVVELKEIGRTKQKGDILSLTAEEAVKVHFADALASDQTGALKAIGYEGVVPIEKKPALSERIADFLTLPAVMTLLLIIGIAGIAIELLVPGFGIPGIAGIAAFALYFFGHYIAGFAGVEDVVLFIIGLILLILEMFIPSFGILGVLGAASIIGGVVMAASDAKTAGISLGVAFIVAIVIVTIVARLFKHRGVWNRFILKDQLDSSHGYVSSEPKDRLIGLSGTSITPLRPAGTAEIEGERVDVVTEGQFIASASPIVVVKVDGTRVVVQEKR